MTLHVQQEPPFRDALHPLAGRPAFVPSVDLPFGAVIAVVTLTACVPVEDITSMSQGLRRHEIAFGNYEPGRFVWVLQNLRRLRIPVPCRGRQQIFTLEFDVEAAVCKQLGAAA